MELTGFNTSRGLSGDASFFPDNFCIGEDGEDLTYCLGPDLQELGTTFVVAFVVVHDAVGCARGAP